MANTSGRFGDRKEGRRLHALNPIYKIMPYIMVKRNDACNHFSAAIEISEADKYLRTKREEGYKGIGMLEFFIAAYIRTCAMYPGLNRFVSGQRIYARNDITVIMTVKRNMSTDASETSIKVHFKPSDTLFDVHRKLGEKIDEIKANNGTNNTEDAAEFFFKLPGLLLKFVVWLLNLFDYFDLLPRWLLEASPFHGSMIITDLGSLGISPIYHHLYNFGNLPVFLSFGAKRRAVELDSEGRAVKRKYVDLKVVCDERTVDGFYYAAAFKTVGYLFRHPEILEQPPERVVEDVM